MVRKQANYTIYKKKQLANSWLVGSMDSTSKIQQKSEVYWKKFSKHYHKAMDALVKTFPKVVKKVPRILRSLMSK